ncbi:uncharacterized protein DFL_000521 [Arthrobotrys flagrans]|uniref:Extracellular membrane protein CFEM domain-containing protein n=1 Tax=Arthrobotrys flagrans TaxID=97331 RepID=A0A437AFA0_ARTFL|nr:hypothetical protein DFL_000521 [Arthrobotrys flagrans]
MSSSRFFTLAALIINIPTILAQKAVVQTITNLDSYAAGRVCMRDCIFKIAGRNGCDNTNDCICRIDLQPQMTSYLSTCISNSCAGYTRDVNSGISIYQSYCSGKADDPEPVVTPVATEEVIETTVIERITVEATATATETNFATETVDDVATVTRTSFATQVVNGVTTLTSFTETTTIRVPSSLTQIEYQTFTAVFNSTDNLRQTLEMWGIGSEKGLTMQGKVAVGLGVGMGVFLAAFLVTLCCCLSRRSELMKRNRIPGPGTGGNVGWPDDSAAAKY